MTKHCCRILVVEDDAAIRETIKEMLELEGFRVNTAANGQDALQMLEEIRTPCLILLDLMMPVMNGWEFLEAIRGRNDVVSTIPITVLTALDAAEVSSYGCRLMKKPPNIDHLIAVAHDYCRHAD